MLPFSSFNSLFPDDFFGFKYPENYSSKKTLDNFRVKRNAQQKVLQQKSLLEDALERGNSEESALLARDLAESKLKLLNLSRSSSSLQIADEADEMLRVAQESLVPSQNQNFNKQYTDLNYNYQPRHRVPIIEDDFNIPEVKNKEMNIKNIQPHIMDIDEPKPENEKNFSNLNELKPQEDGHSFELEPTSNVEITTSGTDNQLIDANEQIEIKNDSTLDIKKNKLLEEKSKKEVEEICSKTRDVLEKSKKCNERALYLVQELQKFKKDFYEIDGTIMNAILKLDCVDVKGEAKEMRKKAIAYYTQALKDLDESVKPLNEFELKFKSQV